MKIDSRQDILSFPLFSPVVCRSFLSHLHNAKWKRSKVYSPRGSRFDFSSRRSSQIWLPRLPVLKEIYDRVARPIINKIILFCWKYRIAQHHSLSVVRYTEGGYYGLHTDVPVPGLPRVLSLVCYLNHGFTGGGTRFPRQKILVQPSAGKVILFPSGITHPHSAEKVSSGIKYALVGWLY